MKALFSLGDRALSVQYYLPVDRLLALIQEKGNPLPPQATEMLTRRGFLPATGHGGKASDFETSLNNAIEAAQFKYVMYCVLVQDAEFSPRTVDAFLAEAKELEANGVESTHTVSARIIQDTLDAGVSREAIALRAKAAYEGQG